MLHRPTRKSSYAEQERERAKRYRARQRAGRAIVPIEINSAIVNWLVRTHWLPPREAHSRAELAAAIGAMLKDAARG
jgi:hypothetical protein